MNYYHPDTDFFRKYGLSPPETISHGTEEDISERLKPSKPTNWRLEGNKLIADTEIGQIVNFIDPGYICTGTDNHGHPVLKRIA